MTDVVAFIEAHLAVDERLARAAGATRSGKVASWNVTCGCAGEHADDCYERRVEGDNIVIYNEGGHDEDQARHIARHDPVRVLAEVTAIAGSPAPRPSRRSARRTSPGRAVPTRTALAGRVTVGLTGGARRSCIRWPRRMPVGPATSRSGRWRREAAMADAVHEAAGRVRAWRRQLDADMRAWYIRNGHQIPDPLFPPDEDVPCRYGCGTDLEGPDGAVLLLLADLDVLLAGKADGDE